MTLAIYTQRSATGIDASTFQVAARKEVPSFLHRDKLPAKRMTRIWTIERVASFEEEFKEISSQESGYPEKEAMVM